VFIRSRESQPGRTWRWHPGTHDVACRRAAPAASGPPPRRHLGDRWSSGSRCRCSPVSTASGCRRRNAAEYASLFEHAELAVQPGLGRRQELV